MKQVRAPWIIASGPDLKAPKTCPDLIPGHRGMGYPGVCYGRERLFLAPSPKEILTPRRSAVGRIGIGRELTFRLFPSLNRSLH